MHSLLPAERDDLGVSQRFGPGVEAAFIAGWEPLSRFVVSGQIWLDWEGALHLDGRRIDESERFDTGLGAGVSWRVHPHWTLQAAVDTQLYVSHLGKQVAMIGIASNADDDLNRLRAELADKPFPLPVVLDVGGQLARSLDVYSTPTVVLLDSEGNVRFQGWLDNEEDLDDDDREPYLEEALEAILRGQSVERPDSPIYGCPMTRSL